MLERLGRFAARRHWWFIGVWVVAAIALGSLSNSHGGRPRDVFSIPGTEAQNAVDILQAEFPAANGGSATVVFKAKDGIVTDPANAAAIEKTLTNLEGITNVSPILNPLAPGSLTAGNISADQTIVYAGMQFSVPVDEIPKDIIDQMRTAGEPATKAGVEVQFGGSVVDAYNAPTSVISEHADDIGLLFAVVILLISLGAAVAMFVPIGTALFGVGVSTAVLVLVERWMVIGSLGPVLGLMIGLGVGIDYSLFVVSRFRQGLADGLEPEDATGLALGTAGSAVLFAGLTVCLAMGALALIGVPYVTELGLSAALFVVITVLVALTFLPAVLGALGPRINKGQLPWHDKATELTTEAATRTFSGRWAHEMARRPLVFSIVSLVLLLLLAVPLLKIDLGFPTDGSAPTDTTQRQAYDLITEGFGPGANGPLLIVGPLPADAKQDPAKTLATLETFVKKLETTPGVKRVIPGSNPPDYTIAFIEVVPTTGPNDGATAELVNRLRDTAVPDALAGSSIDAKKVYVGGATAQLIDLKDRIDARFPTLIAVVLAGSFLLLMMVFRSLFVPFKAAIMNLLSIAAAYGVLVAVFQWGWGRGAIGLQETVIIAVFVPVMMFAILFGLSMDYEVFLLSRIREEYLKSGDSHNSVVVGLANTARVITSAALIMIAVFLSFVTNPDPTVKMIGFGLAVAVFIDATIVRMVLVPSTMELVGKGNWWLPAWLDRVLPHINVDTPPESANAQPNSAEHDEVADRV